MSVTPLKTCLVYGMVGSGLIAIGYARYVSLGLVTFWSILSWLILYWIIIHHDQYRYFSFIHCDRASKAPHEAGRASKPTPTTGYPISRVSIVRCKTCRNPDDIPDLPSTFRLTLPKTFSSPFQPSPRLSTPPSTTSHRRSNASRSNRSRDTNLFATAVVFSPSCTKLVESGFLALLENANGTYSTTGFTFSAIGQAPHHKHLQTNRLYRQLRIGAANHKRSRTQGEPFLPGTALSRALSRSSTSVIQFFPPGRTSGTRPAIVCGSWESPFVALPRTLFQPILTSFASSRTQE